MSALSRTTRQGSLGALRAHNGIKLELDRLEKTANRQMRKTLPRFQYNGEVAETLLKDLAEVVSRDDWRRPLERSAEGLRGAAKHIHKAVRLAVRAADNCSTYATIPAIVWASTSEAEAERQRSAALPAGDRLFGRRGAIESLRKRERRAVLDARKIAPNFLKAMSAYAAQCEREAACLDSILKVRDRRYDRLGPMLQLIRDVQSFTGKEGDAAVARLLADAYEIAGITKPVSQESIRKLRERHLAPQA